MEPIAKRLRQSGESAIRATKVKDDVEQQIKQLEAQLEQNSSSESSDDSGDDSDDSDNEAIENTVVSLSVFANERVDGLAQHLLPKPSASSVNLTNNKKRSQELESLSDTMQLQKVPFACKPCGFIGKNLEEFLAHRESKEHLSNQSVQFVCKLCDKSFTSANQLEEHKAGKWHQQRTQQRKARHVVKICYDFVRGKCQWGDKCAFEHTETKAMKSGKIFKKTKKRLCATFQHTNNCKFGDNCLFSHTFE